MTDKRTAEFKPRRHGKTTEYVKLLAEKHLSAITELVRQALALPEPASHIPAYGQAYRLARRRLTKLLSDLEYIIEYPSKLNDKSHFASNLSAELRDIRDYYMWLDEPESGYGSNHEQLRALLTGIQTVVNALA